MKLINHINLERKTGKKFLAVLLDPDNFDKEKLAISIKQYEGLGVDFLFVGGSLLISSEFPQFVSFVKKHCSIPVIIFPGSSMQLSDDADGILFLSLISGRNADLLIGQHILAAPTVRKSNIEVLPTGYMLVDCGNRTTAHYISQTSPIPYDKPEIAACTAMAGEMLGLQLMYLDGGSGAKKPVSIEMIRAVKKNTSTPIIVGGGIRTRESLDKAFSAGADIVVIGNSLEDNPDLIYEFSQSDYIKIRA